MTLLIPEGRHTQWCVWAVRHACGNRSPLYEVLTYQGVLTRPDIASRRLPRCEMRRSDSLSAASFARVCRHQKAQHLTAEFKRSFALR